MFAPISFVPIHFLNVWAGIGHPPAGTYMSHAWLQEGVWVGSRPVLVLNVKNEATNKCCERDVRERNQDVRKSTAQPSTSQGKRNFSRSQFHHSIHLSTLLPIPRGCAYRKNYAFGFVHKHYLQCRAQYRNMALMQSRTNSSFSSDHKWASTEQIQSATVLGWVCPSMYDFPWYMYKPVCQFYSPDPW